MFVVDDAMYAAAIIAMEEAAAVAAAEAAATAAATAAAETAAAAAAQGAAASAAEAGITAAATDAAATAATTAAAETGGAALGTEGITAAATEGAQVGLEAAVPEAATAAEAAAPLPAAGSEATAAAGATPPPPAGIEQVATAPAAPVEAAVPPQPAGIEQAATAPSAPVEAAAPPQPAGIEQAAATPQPAGVEQSLTQADQQALEQIIAETQGQPVNMNAFEPTANAQGTVDAGGQQLVPKEPVGIEQVQVGQEPFLETGGQMGNGTEVVNQPPPPQQNPFMKGVEWATNNPTKAIPMAVTAAGLIGGAMQGNNGMPSSTKSTYNGPLKKYKLSSSFQPSSATPNVYKAGYAEGGAVERMSQMDVPNQYPMGMQDHTQYATPTQMPTSAEVVRADYDTKTDPRFGTQMAAGGIAGYAKGGDLMTTLDRYNEMMYGRPQAPSSDHGDVGIYYDMDPETKYKDALSASQIRLDKVGKRANMPKQKTSIKPQPLGQINLGPANAKKGSSASTDEDEFAKGGIAQIQKFGIGGDVAKFAETMQPGGFVGDTQDKFYAIAHPEGWLGDKAEEIAPGGTLGQIHDAATPGRAEYLRRKREGREQKTFAEGGSTVPIRAADRTTSVTQTSYDPETGQQSEYTTQETYKPSQSRVASDFQRSPDLVPNAYRASYAPIQPRSMGRTWSAASAPRIGIAQIPQNPGRPWTRADLRRAEGGSVYDLGSYAHGGNPRLLRGPGDGMSDNIPATIGGKQPARLADGEFVIPADVVSALGNGSTEAGARELHDMMDRIRGAAHGKKTQQRKVKPGKVMPK